MQRMDNLRHPSQVRKDKAETVNFSPLFSVCMCACAMFLPTVIHTKPLVAEDYELVKECDKDLIDC